MGAPSKLSVMRKAAVLSRASPTLLLSWTEKAARRKWNWSRSVCVQTELLNLPKAVSFCCHFFVVYYESMKRELKTRPIYECRYDERLKTKAEESTRLVYTGLLGELEHLKIETRLIEGCA